MHRYLAIGMIGLGLVMAPAAGTAEAKPKDGSGCATASSEESAAYKKMVNAMMNDAHPVNQDYLKIQWELAADRKKKACAGGGEAGPTKVPRQSRSGKRGDI
ncbi:hypothetical protein [Mycolicibacterium houstonense]|uniref:hypothetical protein n=1 Tax=Mycolicibacterium houstonense TaxID=146021 RepID=UPI003F997EB9